MSLAATYGNVGFIGNIEARQFAKPVFEIPSYGHDSAKVVYDVGVTKLDAFMDSLVKFSPFVDRFGAKVAAMYLDSWTPDDAKQYPKVTLSYIGTKDGVEKPPQVSTSLVQQNGDFVQESGGSAILSFNAPRTTYKWVQYTKPVVPKYATSAYSAQQLVDLFQAENSWLHFTDAYLLTFVQRNAIAEFQTEELVPNCMWSCTSSIDTTFSQQTVVRPP